MLLLAGVLMHVNRIKLIVFIASISIPALTQASHNPPPLPDPVPAAIPTGPFMLEFAEIASTFVFPTFVKAIPDGSG
jgi:hypothetical protein